MRLRPVMATIVGWTGSPSVLSKGRTTSPSSTISKHLCPLEKVVPEGGFQRLIGNERHVFDVARHAGQVQLINPSADRLLKRLTDFVGHGLERLACFDVDQLDRAVDRHVPLQRREDVKDRKSTR